MTDSELILEIQTILDGTVWSVDMLDEIAGLLRESGYQIGEAN